MNLITKKCNYIFVAVSLVATQYVNACDVGAIKFPITDINTTHIRAGFGEYGAARQGNNTHTGVDIVVNQSHQNPSAYEVRAIAGGVIAYSRLNGSADTGFGNTIVIDHENGCYSFYAHLAGGPFTPMAVGGNLLRQVGDHVSAGDLIGYMVNLKGDVDSTGNARRTDQVAKLQVHFELIKGNIGRRGNGPLVGSILLSNSDRQDPTDVLNGLGYKTE